jgi:2,5-diamino-6-(ribosylamino)-4(3H)-pyrimidinone 5'-phosphate reductase
VSPPGMLDRPYVVVLVNASADGRLALGPNLTWWDRLVDPRTKKPDEAFQTLFREARSTIKHIHNPQAHMHGAGSLIKEGAPLQPLPPYEGDPRALYQDFLPDDVVHQPGREVWAAIVDGRGRLRSGDFGEGDRLGKDWLRLTSRSAPAAYLAFLQRERIPYLIAGEQRVDLRAVLGKLKDKLGIGCVLSMAGGRLNGALLRAGLLDEINIIYRPELIGGTQTPTPFDSPELAPDEWPTRLRLISAQVRGEGHVWLRYEVHVS